MFFINTKKSDFFVYLYIILFIVFVFSFGFETIFAQEDKEVTSGVLIDFVSLEKKESYNFKLDNLKGFFVELEEKFNEAKEKEREFLLLAKIIEAEAKGENIKGKIAVGNVIMNRVNSDKFPNTIEEVIFQKKQFTPVSNGMFQKAKPTKSTIEAVKRVMEGENFVSEALFFFNPKITNDKFSHSRIEVITIGNHRFTK